MYKARSKQIYFLRYLRYTSLKMRVVNFSDMSNNDKLLKPFLVLLAFACIYYFCYKPWSTKREYNQLYGRVVNDLNRTQRLKEQKLAQERRDYDRLYTRLHNDLNYTRERYVVRAR